METRDQYDFAEEIHSSLKIHNSAKVLFFIGKVICSVPLTANFGWRVETSQGLVLPTELISNLVTERFQSWGFECSPLIRADHNLQCIDGCYDDGSVIKKVKTDHRRIFGLPSSQKLFRISSFYLLEFKTYTSGARPSV